MGTRSISGFKYFVLSLENETILPFNGNLFQEMKQDLPILEEEI
jgi:hypothetical protein